MGFLVILVIPVSLFLVVLLASVDDLVLGEDGRNAWLMLAIFSNKIMYLRSLRLFFVWLHSLECKFLSLVLLVIKSLVCLFSNTISSVEFI